MPYKGALYTEELIEADLQEQIGEPAILGKQRLLDVPLVALVIIDISRLV